MRINEIIEEHPTYTLSNMNTISHTQYEFQSRIDSRQQLIADLKEQLNTLIQQRAAINLMNMTNNVSTLILVSKVIPQAEVH